MKFLQYIERKDCAVHAIKDAFNVKYNIAHKWAESKLERSLFDGVSMIDKKLDNIRDKGISFNKRFISKGFRIDRDRYTVEQFLKEYPSGTYLIHVYGHIFCIENGYIHGSQKDRKNKDRKILTAYEIIFITK